MNVKRKKRLVWILCMVMGVGVSISLVLFALNKNINLYYTPSQLPHDALPTANLRIGGLVKAGSLKHEVDSLKVYFVITDYKREVPVTYTGIVPSLFREGQGVVVEGRFNQQLFEARQVLAKHDEKYMPPNIERSSASKR